MATEKTFYLETFGCQMNAHDSEKVIGTLQQQGYRQVETEEDAGLILYNTCSIRDKAEQKVFNRLNDYKKLHKAGKRFGVLGCVAQQEGEKIFERAPYVSLVSGSASYRKLPEMLARLEAGETRITGLDDRQTDETFETEFTARQNPYRGYITIIEGCDKFCAYCVVPYTRGKERSRGSIVGAGRGAPHRRPGLHRDSAAGPEREQLSRSGREVELRRTAGCRRARWPAFAACALPPAIRATLPATSSRPSTPYPTLCDHVHLPVQSGSSRVLKMMAREYTPEWYLERIAWIKAAQRPISLSTDIIVGFPGETPDDFIQTMDLLAEVEYDCVFGFKYSARPNTPALTMIDSIPDDGKAQRGFKSLLDRQREIQRHQLCQAFRASNGSNG